MGAAIAAIVGGLIGFYAMPTTPRFSIQGAFSNLAVATGGGHYSC